MVIDLTLNYAYGKYSNNKQCLSSGEVLNIKLSGDKHLRGLQYFAIIKLGENRTTIKIDESGIFQIPMYMTKETGNIDIIIKAYNKGGAVACEYTCESLIIVNVDGQYEPIPQIERMENRIAKIEKALTEIYKIIKNKGDLGL